ncbi:uncharacterized protein BO80DRAFT_425626, partial [Aspergillus ibericus CBS 121593]
MPIGSRWNAQPYAMRAPEVFLGQPCTAPSGVWAIAAMLLCWIKPGILGVWDSPHPFINEAWCMAKIKRLFPHWETPGSDTIDDPLLKAALDSAHRLGEGAPELQAILGLDAELQRVGIPEQLRDLLRFMLVVDPVQRPSAFSVLTSKELKALEKVVSV